MSTPEHWSGRTRPSPFLHERLMLLDDGRSLYEWKSRFRDGTTHVAARRGDGILAR